jgi:hypothetical protein
MWPTGDADGEGGAKYVPGVTALWAQWRKVVDLMKERDPSKVAQVNGFERFCNVLLAIRRGPLLHRAVTAVVPGIRVYLGVLLLSKAWKATYN